MVATTAGVLPYAVETTPTPPSVRIGWLVAALAGAGAVAYGVYEWRDEIRRSVSALLRKRADK
jgi:hypothetical protein